MIHWFTDAIAKKYNRIKYNEDVSNEFHDLLLRIFRLYSSHEMDYDSLVSEIMMRTRDYIRAREIQYYIPVNKEKRELYLYEEGIIGKRRLYRKKLPVQLEDDLVLSYVWENNQYLNVAGKNLKKFDIKNAKIKSILCVPVGSKNNVVAIVKAINKFKGRFVVEDAVELRHSAIFCALAYKQHLARDNYRIMEKVVKNEQKRVIHYSQPCEHDIDTFLSQVFKTPLPKNITKFTWYPNENDLGLLLEYSWWMFRHLFKTELFFGKIAAFLLAVRHGYRKKPYHNFEHAFGMMHIIFVILHLHSNDFSMFEKTCLMIASICHDIHHPGVSNTFLRLSKNPLAELYEESTLENYHSYMTRLLLDHYGLFSYLPSSEYLRYKKEIHELILYTDLDIAITTKFPLARQLINDNNYDDKKHRYLLKSLIMNSADLAGQSKSLDFSGRITALWKNELHIETCKKGMARTYYTNISRCPTILSMKLLAINNYY
ncbi:hypothetical protein O3M35_000129 [Rhynocoris fuscipes]|uniref:Phosphodiesterase n=1 Tax=Rhynocoris fuscipes TaxID=488301 RepID=A0AAW1DMF3_9HEMI